MTSMELGSQSRTEASWSTNVSNLFLECLIKQHKSGRSGNNGLKKEQWVDIVKIIKERCNMTYEVEQLRNHYRVWKARIKALGDLQKQSGLGWNSVDNKFDVPQHVWNEFKKKEEKFWREHRVLQLHLDVAVWMGNEIATGNDSFHPFDALYDDNIDSVPIDGLDNMDFDAFEDSYVHPNASGIPVGSSNRSGRRPRSDATSGKPPKKKKGGADKVASPLKAIAEAMKEMVKKDPEADFCSNLFATINAISGKILPRNVLPNDFFKTARP
ncbi:uncharacterized protein LOC122668588 [Telopea speciosissima]|uniref:uncharacterized protein LOC122668588 n=1 Tax=Telopea speciosissima TaxID=54955 RepID=UPI001CC5A730|nr:uncharacterized protein LOC122668588 [Telopea speciosissima]